MINKSKRKIKRYGKLMAKNYVKSIALSIFLGTYSFTALINSIPIYKVKSIIFAFFENISNFF